MCTLGTLVINSRISRFQQMIPPSRWSNSSTRFLAVMSVSSHYREVSVRKPNLSYSSEYTSPRLLISITRLSIIGVLTLSPALMLEIVRSFHRYKRTALKSDSTHHFFRNTCTKSGSLRFSQFSGC